jgi:hypothetical protein
VKPVFPSQSGDNWVAEIRKARQDRIASMRRQICTDGIGMSDIEEQGRHSRKTKVFD